MALKNAFENLATEAKQDAILTELQKKADGNETQPVSVTNPTDISLLALASKQLPDNHQVVVSNQPTGFATSAKQLPDGHNVTILNPTADPETGLAKESKQLPDNHQVTISNQLTGFATEAKQDTLLTELQKKADSTETQPVSVTNQLDITSLATSAKQLPNNHQVTVSNQLTGVATEAKQSEILTELQKKADVTETQPVSVVNPVDVSSLATALKQLPDGHNVTVLNPTANPETGLAKESKQLPDNHQVSVSNQITGFSTSTKQDDILTELQKKADVTETQPVSLATQPLPDGASTSAIQTNGLQKTQIVDNTGDIVNVEEGKLEVLAELVPMFRQMLMLMANPNYVDKALNSERVYATGGALSTVTTVTTVATVTTVTTVTNLTNFGSQTADTINRINNVMAWATIVRSRIS